jgi:hypothetical protein
MMRRHPWLPAALTGRQTIGPNLLAGMDHVLAILEDTALDTPAKLELLALLIGIVANYVVYEVAQVELARRTRRSAAETAAAELTYLVGAAQSGRYPHLTAALRPATPPPSRKAPAGGTDPDAVFDRLVERILGGLLGH